MGLKDKICVLLNNIESMFGCDGEPKYPRICNAIESAQSAFGCDIPSPPDLCENNTCVEGYECDPLDGLCKGITGVGCSLDIECLGGICEDNVCL